MPVHGAVQWRVALAAYVVALVVVNAHPLWRPWTGGLITEAYAQTVWAADLALVVQILMTVALLWSLAIRAPAIHWWAVPLRKVVNVAGGLLSLGVFVSVYPLDLGALGLEEWTATVRFALGVAVVGVMVALVVTLLRSAGAVLGGGAPAVEAPTDPQPSERPRRPSPQRPPPKRSRRNR
jgi:hypothetical protein